MGKYAKASQRVGVGLPNPGDRPTDLQLDRLLALSFDADPKVRRLVLKNMCPCHVRRNRMAVWERVFEMVHDPDAGVRLDAFHALADGSPRELAPRVYGAFEVGLHDPDEKTRRFVRILSSRQRRTGRVNVG